MDLIKHKRQLLGMAKSWALATLPGWTEEAHRDLIARHGARPSPTDGTRVSATTMNVVQLESALSDYEARGWVRRRGVYAPTDKPASERKVVPAHIAHMVRLWARLGQAGKVQDASRAALLAWVGRQVGRAVPNLDALEPTEGQRCIEALKAWAAR